MWQICRCNSVSRCTRGIQVKLWDPLRTRVILYLSALEVWSRQGAIQIHVYLYLTCNEQAHDDLIAEIRAGSVKHEVPTWKSVLRLPSLVPLSLFLPSSSLLFSFLFFLWYSPQIQLRDVVECCELRSGSGRRHAEERALWCVWVENHTLHGSAFSYNVLAPRYGFCFEPTGELPVWHTVPHRRRLILSCVILKSFFKNKLSQWTDVEYYRKCRRSK